MATSTSTLETANGSRYLQQLCKHWSHKFTVDFDSKQGTIELPTGVCMLDAAPSQLVIKVDAQEATNLGKLEEVVADHIKRFAFKEDLSFHWKRSAA
ncbi:MAG: DUF2218 domain-containing protein [Rhizobiaceae bacterium]|nr:DUF2218 domain-containing protein [Rhizobiaceae bacterium]